MEHISAGLPGLEKFFKRKTERKSYGAPVGYAEYMESQSWAVRRNEFIRTFSDPCCERCGLTTAGSLRLTRHGLEVHHKTYERLGREADEDLELLCHRCHEKETYRCWTPDMKTWWRDLGYNRNGDWIEFNDGGETL